jgi:hypothetical protein
MSCERPDPPPAVAQIIEAQALIALSDERDRFIKRITESWREGWLTGHQVGYEAGRRDVLAELEAEQHRICEHVKRVTAQPTFGELQKLRYGR